LTIFLLSFHNGFSRVAPVVLGGSFDLVLIIATQFADNHRVERFGQLLAFGGLAIYIFAHAHKLAGRTKLADGQVGGITKGGVLFCWHFLF
jgi:hypothetical protein